MTGASAISAVDLAFAYGQRRALQAAAIRRRIGVVFQSPAVDNRLTVRENLHYYHGIMMFFLLPVLLLSVAFFPMEAAYPLLSWVRFVNPTYGVGALRHAFQGEVAGVPPFTLCLLGTVVFAAATFLLGTFVVMRRSVRDAV